MSTRVQTAEDLSMLRRFMPPAEREIQDKLRAMTGLSEGACVALSLTMQAIREWCPDGEKVKVAVYIAALGGRL